MNWLKKIISLGEKKEKDIKDSKEKKSFFLSRLNQFFFSRPTFDEKTFEDLKEILISADVGVSTSLKIIKRLKNKVKEEKISHSDKIKEIFYQEIFSLINKKDVISIFDQIRNKNEPYVIMVVGVNGVGKTTTIGKLAYKLKENNFKVMLGAADTFRAAAIEQLDAWAKKIDVPIVKQKIGADPSSVAFDCLESAKAKKIDVVLIDTAGRLHNKSHLMEELSRIKRVMKKVIPDAPDQVLLVLDGSVGQNAFEQARHFNASTQLNALAITKLDGTAKGGVIIGIADEFDIPIRYIGLGEKMQDLEEFNAKDFISSLI